MKSSCSVENAFWTPDGPDNYGSGEDCVGQWYNQGWNDYSCDQTADFVCQKGFCYLSSLFNFISANLSISSLSGSSFSK